MLALFLQDVAEIAMRLRITWPETNGFPVFGLCLGKFALAFKGDPEVVMRLRPIARVRVEADSLPVLDFGAGKVTLIGKGIPQVVVRARIIWLDEDSLAEFSLSLGNLALVS